MRIGGPQRRDHVVGRGVQHRVDERQHGARPDFVSARIRVQQIREQLNAETSFRIEILVREIAPDHALAVRKLGDFLVHHVVAATDRIVRVCAAREDRSEGRAGIRRLRGDHVKDRADAEDRIDGRLLRKREMSAVVRPDHEQDTLRLVAVQLATLGQAPEDMFGAIGARTEVERLVSSGTKVFLPRLLLLPKVSDGVADENDLRTTVGDGGHLLGVALHLPAVGVAVPGGRRDRADGSERGGERKGTNAHKEKSVHFHGCELYHITDTPK